MTEVSDTLRMIPILAYSWCFLEAVKNLFQDIRWRSRLNCETITLWNLVPIRSANQANLNPNSRIFNYPRGLNDTVISNSGSKILNSRATLPRRQHVLSRGVTTCKQHVWPSKPVYVRPISLLRLDSNFPGNSLWAWEFLPVTLRFCLIQTLWHP